MLSNQPARVVQEREVPYLYDVSSESSEGVVSASVTREKEMEGVDMMINANVQQDHVWLRISGQLRKIVSEETESVENLNLKFLTVEKSEITFANKLRYGQTMVIASVKQTSTTAEQTKNFWTSLFGGTGSKSDTTETLVLLTPRKTQ
ncbi:lipoprotein [Vibrio variabilis]|nr:lipoprotein [Vibrio variabilis]